MNHANDISNLTSESLEMIKYSNERSQVLDMVDNFISNGVHDPDIELNNFGLDRLPKLVIIFLLFTYLIKRYYSSVLISSIFIGQIIFLVIWILPKIFDYLIPTLVIDFQPIRQLNQ